MAPNEDSDDGSDQQATEGASQQSEVKNLPQRRLRTKRVARLRKGYFSQPMRRSTRAKTTKVSTDAPAGQPSNQNPNIGHAYHQAGAWSANHQLDSYPVVVNCSQAQPPPPPTPLIGLNEIWNRQPTASAPLKELNILILGETGVGKSTWINSIVNYITYPTLDEAINCPDLDWLITSSFRVVTREVGSLKLVQKEVVVRHEEEEADKFENTAVGESATQYARPYVVSPDGRTLIRFIDTPGIGDTRGEDQDKLNFENILQTINRYEQLHGIVILLKPNSARLTVMFRFVVQVSQVLII